MINNLARQVLSAGGDIFPLTVESEYKTGLLNPSIYLNKDKILLNIRHVQYVLYHSENNQFFQSKWGPLAYLHPEHDQTLTTVNYFGEFTDRELKVSKVNTETLDVKPLWEFVGLEDVRIVVWDKKLWMCGVRRDTTINGQGRIEMSQIAQKDGEWKEIKRYRLDTPGSSDTYCEKNWVPINDKPYHFLKWSNPIEIVKVDLSQKCDNNNFKCDQVHLSKKVLSLPRDLRGGTNLVNWDDGYLMILHEVDLFNNSLNKKDAFYYHRLLYLNKDFEVLKISDYFNFLTGNIEFATGLVLINKDSDKLKKDDVYISFGFQDNSAFLLKTDKNFIDNLLIEI